MSAPLFEAQSQDQQQQQQKQQGLLEAPSQSLCLNPGDLSHLSINALRTRTIALPLSLMPKSVSGTKHSAVTHMALLTLNVKVTESLI